MVLRQLPRLIPPAVLLGPPDLVGMLYPGGRDASYAQLAYYAPALIGWLVVSTAGNLTIAITRLRSRL